MKMIALVLAMAAVSSHGESNCQDASCQDPVVADVQAEFLQRSILVGEAALHVHKSSANKSHRDARHARKVARESEALKYHHSYCGRSSGRSSGSSAASSKDKQEKASCEDWCATKVSNGANTWYVLCGWDKCSTCDECSSTTTSTTTIAVTKGNCAAFTSSLSPNGLDTCDENKDMPYAYAYHLHPTYDVDSWRAASDLQEAFQANFGIGECEHVDEQTVYSTKEVLCLLSTPSKCNKDTPESWDDVTAIFGLCQFGIYVRAGALFNSSLGADGLSPWQWMTTYKDTFYQYPKKDDSPQDIDVLAHAVMCPSLAHDKWAFFVNGTHETDAGIWITGDNSVDGCYGQECNVDECEAYAEDSAVGVSEVGCCAVTAMSSVPRELDSLMEATYRNVLKFQSGAWWDPEAEEMKDAGEYTPEFPSTVWPDGCQGACNL